MLVPPISECNISVICILCIYVSVFVLITLPLIKKRHRQAVSPSLGLNSTTEVQHFWEKNICCCCACCYVQFGKDIGKWP